MIHLFIDFRLASKHTTLKLRHSPLVAVNDGPQSEDRQRNIRRGLVGGVAFSITQKSSFNFPELITKSSSNTNNIIWGSRTVIS